MPSSSHSDLELRVLQLSAQVQMLQDTVRVLSTAMGLEPVSLELEQIGVQALVDRASALRSVKVKSEDYLEWGYVLLGISPDYLRLTAAVTNSPKPWKPFESAANALHLALPRFARNPMYTVYRSLDKAGAVNLRHAAVLYLADRNPEKVKDLLVASEGGGKASRDILQILVAHLRAKEDRWR